MVGAVELRTGDGGPGLHHQRRPAAALLRAAGAPAGPRRPAAWPASSSPPAQRVDLLRRGRPGAPTRVVVTVARLRRARCPAPSPASLKVTPYAEYPRQGPRHRRGALPPVPARARTPWCSPGPGRRRPALPAPTAWPSSCPSAERATRRLRDPRACAPSPGSPARPRQAGDERADRPHLRRPRRAAPLTPAPSRFDETGSAPSARRPAPAFFWRSSSPGPGVVAPRPSRTCRPRWAGGSTSVRQPGWPARPAPRARAARRRRTTPGGRTAYLALAGPQPWLLRGPGPSPAALLEVDFDALAPRGPGGGPSPASPAPLPPTPVLLVCTNGRRDVCCAVRGRPVALDAAAAAPGRVWEASHTGGHRFAPTGVLLPHGATLARLDADAVRGGPRAARPRQAPRAHPRTPARPGPQRPGAGPRRQPSPTCVTWSARRSLAALASRRASRTSSAGRHRRRGDRPCSR